MRRDAVPEYLERSAVTLAADVDLPARELVIPTWAPSRPPVGSLLGLYGGDGHRSYRYRGAVLLFGW